MIEVEVNDMSFNEAIIYARDTVRTEIKYPDVILIANDIKVHQKGIKELYDSLPISVPFDKFIKTGQPTSIELNNKVYNNWLEICIPPFGTTYIVEKQVEDESNRK